MKTINKIVGAVALSLALTGCPQEEQVDLSGTVVSENYQRGTGGFGGSSSKYSFVIDTSYGRKVIEIIDSSKESVDTFINPGDKISIKVNKDNATKNYFSFFSSDFLEKVVLK